MIDFLIWKRGNILIVPHNINSLPSLFQLVVKIESVYSSCNDYLCLTLNFISLYLLNCKSILAAVDNTVISPVRIKLWFLSICNSWRLPLSSSASLLLLWHTIATCKLLWIIPRDILIISTLSSNRYNDWWMIITD